MDPFLTESTSFLPENLGDDIWDLCYYIFHLNRKFLRGYERVVDYHLTDIKFGGAKKGDEKERREHREYMMDHVKIMNLLKVIGLEQGCYGTSIPTVNLPFSRVLVDRRNGEYREWTIDMCEKLGPVKFLLQERMYEVTDPLDADKAVAKRKRVKFIFRDRVSRDINKLSFETLNIRDTIYNVAPMGGGTRIIRRFHPEFIRPLQTGDPFFASTVPLDFLRAASERKDFVYHPDYIRVFKAPTINGIRNNGYGIPETFMNFREIYHLQVLRRADEAIGEDFVLPFRLLSPAAMNGNFPDPNNVIWKSEMTEMIKRRRSDPYAIHATPFPVTAQSIFGEGRQFVPAESMQWHSENLMDAMNIPVELYKGTIKQELVPVALRLFASGWSWMYRGFNDITRWVSKWVYDLRREDAPDISLESSRQADDIERRQFMVQLASAGEVSRRTAYRDFDIEDPVAEKEDRMQEDIDIARRQQKIETEFQHEQELGALAQDQANTGAGQGGQGGGGDAQGGYGQSPAGVATTPIMRQQQVQEKAQEWASMSNGDRMKDMAAVRGKDQTLYDLAKAELDRIRRSGESQGRQQAMQQAGGGGQQQPPPQ